MAERLEKKRQARHDVIIAEMDNAFHNINIEVETELRASAEQIKNDFKSTDEAAQNLIITINVTEEEQVSNRSTNFFN